MAAASPIFINVATLDQLNAAIAYVDAQTSGDYKIKLTADIYEGTSQLAASGGNLAYANGDPAMSNGHAVAARNDLYALNLDTGVSVTIDGSNPDPTKADFVIDGRNNAIDSDGTIHPGDTATYRGLFVYAGKVGLTDLTIQNTLAKGGGGGAGGAGLGGGLFVAGTGNANGTGKADGGDVTLTNVSFTGDQAVGGDADYLSGGGGGLGGDGDVYGGNGGGGVGSGSGNSGSGDGILLGAASAAGGGGNFGGRGGSFGGGGAGGTPRNDDGDNGGNGGFGGGGGGNINAGNTNEGGFGGAGGSGGNGGFGGGGQRDGIGGFGGGNGNGSHNFVAGHGGGLGAGGGVFVQAGGKLTIAGDLDIDGGGVGIGNGAAGGSSGEAFGSGLFFQGPAGQGPGADTTTLSFGDGTQTIGDDIADYIGSGGQNPNGGPDAADQGGRLAIAKDGSGTLTLGGINTYSGGTFIRGGTLSVASDASLGQTGSAVIFTTGTLELTADGFTSGRNLFIRGQAGVATIQVDTGSATLSGQIEDGAQAGFGDSGALVKSGAGTLTLTTGSSYTGGTTIEDGTLALTAGNAAGSGHITFAPSAGRFAVLQISGPADPGNGNLFGNTLADFTTGSVIDLQDVQKFNGFAQVDSNNVLAVYSNGVYHLYQLDGNIAPDRAYAAAKDATDGSTFVGAANYGHVGVTAGAAYDPDNHVDEALVVYGGTGLSYTAATAIVNGHVQLTVGNGTLSELIDFGTGKQAVGLDFSTNKAAVTLTGGAYGDSLKGGAGADIIDGGRGIDTMAGGAGRDTYIVRDVGDTITEAGNGGVDSVKATVSYTLDTNVERLFLAGSGSIDGTGNAAANYVVGNSGDNRIDGKLGIDFLTGGAGSDTFVFSTTPGAGNADHITDFNPADDTFAFTKAAYGALDFTGTNGTLDPDQFVTLTAQDVQNNVKYGADVRIIYRADKGALYYDADGYGGPAKAQQFAVLDTKPDIDASHFHLFA